MAGFSLTSSTVSTRLGSIVHRINITI